MNNNKELKEKTSLILWGVIILACTGWIAMLLQSANIYYDIINKVSIYSKPDIPIRQLTFGIHAIILCGYIIYFIGLYGFKSFQAKENTNVYMNQIITASWLEAGAFLLNLISVFIPFVLSILFSILAFIGMVISSTILKLTFENISINTCWNKQANKGASQLSISAFYNLNLCWVPFVYFIAVILTFSSFIDDLDNWEYILLVLFNYGEIKEEFEWAFVFFILESLIFILAILYWYIMQLAFRIIGWYNIYKGNPVNENVEVLQTSSVYANDETANVNKETVEENATTPSIEVNKEKNSTFSKGVIYGGIALVFVIIAICAISFLNTSAKKKFVGTWQCNDYKRTASLVMDLNNDKEPGTFTIGSGASTVYFEIISSKVVGNKAELELRKQPDLTGEKISATLMYQEADKGIQMIIGDSKTSRIEMGGETYVFPKQYTLEYEPYAF